MNRGDFVWFLAFCAFTSIMIVPASHEVFVATTKSHPYFMGFVKFAILSSMGELLSIRIVGGEWKTPPGMIYRTIIWGIIGMLIVLMFSVFLNGVVGSVSKDLLWVGDGTISKVMVAFWISAIMNLSFAPTFMAAHRITDTYLDMVCGEGIPLSKVTLGDVVKKIDWQGLVTFVFMKTLPYFWIPAHTITFLLPPEYRVLVAAYLSIALGAILSYGKKSKTSTNAITTAVVTPE